MYRCSGFTLYMCYYITFLINKLDYSYSKTRTTASKAEASRF